MNFSQCPNSRCESRKKDVVWKYIRKNFYKVRWHGQPVRRYLCKQCGKTFSSQTFLDTYRQKRPDLNIPIYELYVSAMTQRRIAKVLKISRGTVVRKFLFMAERARIAHQVQLSALPVKYSTVHFDEMETFEHTRLKPVSIALAVDQDSGKIIDVKTASFACKGKRAALSRLKYGLREDQRPKARLCVVKTIELTSAKNVVLITDQHRSYPSIIKKIIPNSHHIAVKSRQPKRNQFFRQCRRNSHDPLFTLNFTAAKIRHDLSRLQRRVWITTKKISRLQAHLDLYVAFHNGYKI